jgi:hypothetical protein
MISDETHNEFTTFCGFGNMYVDRLVFTKILELHSLLSDVGKKASQNESSPFGPGGSIWNPNSF